VKICYLLPQCDVGGGPRVVLHHLNILHDRGHDVRLFMVKATPSWFPSFRAPVTVCSSYEDAAAKMSRVDGIKVSTWHETAPWVIKSCKQQGTPVYLVQDIETSYYSSETRRWPEVLSTYHLPWKAILADGPWQEACLRAMNVTVPIEVIPPPIDRSVFFPQPVRRDLRRLLVIGRSVPLKGPQLLRETLSILHQMRPQIRVTVFGVERGWQFPMPTTFVERPSDKTVAELYSGSFAFLSTSMHEGFGLPILESMACGTPVVTTLAGGNEDWCVDGKNCLTAEQDPRALASALARLYDNENLQEQLRQNGLITAAQYDLQEIGNRVERFYEGISKTPSVYDTDKDPVRTRRAG
jgi:glycosyltransferase involved in cell wall biosynthesis